MLVANSNQIIFTHQRLAAGINVEINTHFLALSDDRIDLVKA